MVSSQVLQKTVVSWTFPWLTLQQFEIEISNVNPHYYNETKTPNIEDPLSVSRKHGFKRLLNVCKIIVYKADAPTELTVGYSIGIKDRPPPGMYGRNVNSHEESLWWDSVLHLVSPIRESGSCHLISDHSKRKRIEICILLRR